jgi:SAM-dependent methyltransferase
MTDLTPEQVKQKIKQYRWYHSIEVAPGVFTESHVPQFQPMWDFNMRCLENIDFRGKRVLDIGCRDGMFSLFAERRGAREVIGIDNDLSNGAVEFLIPHFQSKVSMKETNLYDLSANEFGQFDLIMFFGVLYHLRYPFWGLKKIIDCLNNGGQLLIESGMLVSEALKDQELLHCPVERSPYREPSSCTFFNKLGLEVTLRSMNVNVIESHTWTPETPKAPVSNLRRMARLIRSGVRKLAFSARRAPSPTMDVRRQFFICQKDESLQQSDVFVYGEAAFAKDWATSYWDRTHDEHSHKGGGQREV